MDDTISPFFSPDYNSLSKLYDDMLTLTNVPSYMRRYLTHDHRNDFISGVRTAIDTCRKLDITITDVAAGGEIHKKFQDIVKNSVHFSINCDPNVLAKETWYFDFIKQHLKN